MIRNFYILFNLIVDHWIYVHQKCWIHQHNSLWLFHYFSHMSSPITLSSVCISNSTERHVYNKGKGEIYLRPPRKWALAAWNGKEHPGPQLAVERRQALVMLPAILLQIQSVFICLIRLISPPPPARLTSFNFLATVSPSVIRQQILHMQTQMSNVQTAEQDVSAGSSKGAMWTQNSPEVFVSTAMFEVAAVFCCMFSHSTQFTLIMMVFHMHNDKSVHFAITTVSILSFTVRLLIFFYSMMLEWLHILLKPQHHHSQCFVSCKTAVPIDCIKYEPSLHDITHKFLQSCIWSSGHHHIC